MNECKHREGATVIIFVTEKKQAPAQVLMNLRDKVLCVFDCEGGTDLRLLEPNQVIALNEMWVGTK